MNRPASTPCAAARRDLLAAERPDAPPAAAAAHLSKCAACRKWQAGLVRLEELVPETAAPAVPVPASLRLALQRGEAHQDGQRRPNPEAARQKLALALSLAASLACFALAYALWPSPSRLLPKSQPDRFAERRAPYLKGARGPAERLTGLTDFAEALLADARAADGERIGEIADDFDRVVGEVEATARSVPVNDRKRLSAVADRFVRAESAATQLAGDWKGRDARMVAAAVRLAARADAAARRLRDLTGA